jgi:hypothetical protein
LIPSADRDIEIYIRNKHPAGVTTFSGDKTLLFVHGTTYPAETTFDLPLGGHSMMLWISSTRPIIGGDGALGAYRMVSKEAAKQRWLAGVSENKKADLIPDRLV